MICVSFGHGWLHIEAIDAIPTATPTGEKRCIKRNIQFEKREGNYKLMLVKCGDEYKISSFRSSDFFLMEGFDTNERRQTLLRMQNTASRWKRTRVLNIL